MDSFYRAKGCRPVVRPGECCPSSWDCSRWEERLQRRDECFAVSADHPFGKFYAVGESMEEVSVGCNIGCRWEEILAVFDLNGSTIESF